MLPQQLTKGYAEDAHATAVDDADARESGEEGAVDEFFDFAAGAVDGLADDVDFGGDFRAFVGDGDGNAAGSGCFYRSLGPKERACQDCGDVGARDLHFQRTHFDFEVIVVELAGDAGGAAGGLQLDGVAFKDVLNDLRLGVRISLIGAGGVRDDG